MGMVVVVGGWRVWGGWDGGVSVVVGGSWVCVGEWGWVRVGVGYI